MESKPTIQPGMELPLGYTAMLEEILAAEGARRTRKFKTLEIITLSDTTDITLCWKIGFRGSTVDNPRDRDLITVVPIPPQVLDGRCSLEELFPDA